MQDRTASWGLLAGGASHLYSAALAIPRASSLLSKHVPVEEDADKGSGGTVGLKDATKPWGWDFVKPFSCCGKFKDRRVSGTHTYTCHSVITSTLSLHLPPLSLPIADRMSFHLSVCQDVPLKE